MKKVKVNYKTLADLTRGVRPGNVLQRGTSWTRGYVTRKSRSDDKIPCYYSPRKKAYYVLFPSFVSTQYCHRVWYFEI